MFLGIDLGTSSIKAVLADQTGTLMDHESAEYPVCYPHEGWSEQSPQDWLEGLYTVLAGLGSRHDLSRVEGISFCGQMHGLVVLDKADQVIRPALLWNDNRTVTQTDALNREPGREELVRRTGNIAITGFTAPKLLWLRENEPEHFARICKIMLPKDYLVYCLTGVHATDYSDASGTLLLDVEHKCWSRDMLALCGISESQMPRLYESFAPVGMLLPETAAALGLPQGVTVCAGAGDNAAAAVGTGTVSTGAAHADSRCNISLGTSGTIFISSEKFGVDATNGLHAFAHADGGWHLMGCMLSAASCNKWWQDAIIGTNDYKGEEAKIAPEMLGRNHVYFLPYLMGERSPINDTNARAMFVGMTMDTARADMTQAMLEGVAFAIRDSFEVAKGLGLSVPRSNICGGGSRSMLWKRILANVLGIPLDVVKTSEGPGYGAALLAMVACGEYETVAQACSALVRTVDTVEPDASLTALYEERYRQFRQIYPVCRALFPKLL